MSYWRSCFSCCRPGTPPPRPAAAPTAPASGVGGPPAALSGLRRELTSPAWDDGGEAAGPAVRLHVRSPSIGVGRGDPPPESKSLTPAQADGLAAAFDRRYEVLAAKSKNAFRERVSEMETFDRLLESASAHGGLSAGLLMKEVQRRFDPATGFVSPAHWALELFRGTPSLRPDGQPALRLLWRALPDLFGPVLAVTTVQEVNALPSHVREALASGLTDGLHLQLTGRPDSLIVAALRAAAPLTLQEFEIGLRAWLKGMAVGCFAEDEPMITGMDIHALHQVLQALSTDHFAGDPSERAEQLEAAQRLMVSLCDGLPGFSEALEVSIAKQLVEGPLRHGGWDAATFAQIAALLQLPLGGATDAHMASLYTCLEPRLAMARRPVDARAVLAPFFAHHPIQGEARMRALLAHPSLIPDLWKIVAAYAEDVLTWEPAVAPFRWSDPVAVPGALAAKAPARGESKASRAEASPAPVRAVIGLDEDVPPPVRTLRVGALHLAVEFVEDEGEDRVLVRVLGEADRQALLREAPAEGHVQEVARGDGQGGHFSVPRAWIAAGAAAGVPPAG